MLKVGICDDNESLMRKHARQIEEVLNENQIVFEMHTFRDGSEVIAKFQEDRQSLDLLFLDILMEQINGIDTALKIREMSVKTILVFLTSSEEYVFDSMGIQSTTYLMKDQLTKTELEKVILKANTKIVKERSEVFVMEKNGDTYTIPCSDICFIKLNQSSCCIHHWNGSIYESQNLAILDNMKDYFFRVHEQYIINLQYIASIEDDRIILSDKSESKIPMDKHSAKEVKLSFAKYMLEKN